MDDARPDCPCGYPTPILGTGMSLGVMIDRHRCPRATGDRGSGTLILSPSSQPFPPARRRAGADAGTRPTPATTTLTKWPGTTATPVTDSWTARDWTSGNSGRTNSRTHVAGGKRPNELGLYDMSGNVAEWCLDRYREDYCGEGPAADPRRPATGSHHVERGGSWHSPSICVRTAFRLRIRPSDTYNDLGFRVVLAPVIEQPKQ